MFFGPIAEIWIGRSVYAQSRSCGDSVKEEKLVNEDEQAGKTENQSIPGGRPTTWLPALAVWAPHPARAGGGDCRSGTPATTPWISVHSAQEEPPEAIADLMIPNPGSMVCCRRLSSVLPPIAATVDARCCVSSGAWLTRAPTIKRLSTPTRHAGCSTAGSRR